MKNKSLLSSQENEKYDISSLPVVDSKKKVLGIVTSGIITELFEIK